MHTEKQSIFDKYAVSIGYNSWEDFITDSVDSYNSKVTGLELIDHFYKACDLVQAEQQKRIADESITVDLNTGLEEIVLKDSITNPENLIK